MITTINANHDNHKQTGDSKTAPNHGGGASDHGGGATNMREHTDPGLLTLTLASRTPGLQVRDRLTDSWLDVEAQCDADTDCIVLAGEALQFGTAGRYVAAPHCVRGAEAARLSTVFELRLHSVNELD